MPHAQARLVQAVRPLTPLWRGPDSLQLGVDSESVILEPVPGEVVGVLELLREPRSLSELTELTPELDPDWLVWLLERLESAALLRTWRPAAPRPVVVWGTGALAERVHAALQRAELQPLPLGQRCRLGPRAPLIVLATNAAEPDRWLTDRISSAGGPALIVRAEADCGVIGPFVHPARTACLRCLDLLRTDADPKWPLLLAQLCRTPITPAPVLLEWLAGEVVAEVCRWQADRLPELAGRTFELSLTRGQRTSLSWPRHPDCDCQRRPGLEGLGTLAG